MREKKTVLLVTDFSYQAKGREYFREDVTLSCFLRKVFKVCISHIADVDRVINSVDIVLLRNTGPQMLHQNQLMKLRKRADVPLFNDLCGKGDINGKRHLRELFILGFPVIPTFTSKEEAQQFGSCERYLIKPVDGADSCGVKILTPQELLTEECHTVLIQPLIDFQYEVSFYFIGEQFQYALYAPDPERRWALQPYAASEEDIKFAQQFIQWNTCLFGIQRVDACRVQDGRLLLMELEDYNPFLSLDLVHQTVKEQFLKALCMSLEELISEKAIN